MCFFSVPMRGWGLLFLVMIAGCAKQAEPAVVPMAVPITTPATVPPPPPAPAPIVPRAPEGYVEVDLLSVQPGGGGATVELVDRESKKVVTMYIGGTEGHSITLRNDKRPPERPLTHDLLDALLHELHAEILQVQVDKLDHGVFFGTVIVVQDDRVFPLDARPSDAIALALGAKAPIYVARKVIEKSGEDRN
jgi:bifunctional DNase/RNase